VGRGILLDRIAAGVTFSDDTYPMLAPEAFESGTVVWAKIQGHPWWPAKIASTEEVGEDAGDNADAVLAEDKINVVFFGDETYAEAKSENIRLFEEYKEQMIKRCRSAFFRRAVEEANQYMENGDGNESPGEESVKNDNHQQESGTRTSRKRTQKELERMENPGEKRSCRKPSSGAGESGAKSPVPKARSTSVAVASTPVSRTPSNPRSIARTPGGTRRVRWIGKPLKNIETVDKKGDKANTDKYYEGFRLDEDEYHIGDCVFVRMDDEEDDLWVAELESLWEDQYMEKWFEGRWFYSSRTAKIHRSNWAGAGNRSHRWLSEASPHELYESDHVDENTIDCIEGKAEVMTETDFYAAKKRTSLSQEKQAFFCKAFYSTKTRIIRPILGADKRVKRARIYSKRMKSYDNFDGKSGPNSDDDLDAGTRNSNESNTVGDEDFEAPMIVRGNMRKSSKQSFEGCARACAALQLSHVPKSLPCREKERGQIMTFLKGAVDRGGLGNALYISGMPGTGKTATVMEVVRTLKANAAKGISPDFQFIEINGMKLPHPYEAYSIIWKALTGEDAPVKRAAMLLERRFSTPSSKRSCCVLLVDELDYMVTRKQTVLYNLFDWPSRRYARLIVVGIANTMDLPERLLPRISSRMGLERVIFPGYTVSQIETIMKARLGELEVFEDTAVEICARKVASISGDIRRALQIARRAAEICDREAQDEQDIELSKTGNKAPCVTIRHINAAHKELTSTAYILAVKSAAKFERIMLAAVVLQIRSSGIEEIFYDDVVRRFESLCRTRGGVQSQHPKCMEIKALCRRLAASGLLGMEKRSIDYEWQPKVRLNVLMDDVVFALADDPVTRNLF
jgi:origin recognition complex subunit 1